MVQDADPDLPPEQRSEENSDTLQLVERRKVVKFRS